MQPSLARGRGLGFGGKAGAMKPAARNLQIRGLISGYWALEEMDAKIQAATAARIEIDCLKRVKLNDRTG